MDSYWLEATLKEAERHMFPELDQARISKSHDFARRGAGIAKIRSEVPRPYCFPVAKDLSTVDPFNVAYPFHHMGGAYSPFREIAERRINSLQEIKSIMPIQTI